MSLSPKTNPIHLKKETPTQRKNRKRREKLKRQSIQSLEMLKRIQELQTKLEASEGDGSRIRNYNEPFVKPVPDVWAHVLRRASIVDEARATELRESLSKSLPVTPIVSRHELDVKNESKSPTTKVNDLKVQEFRIEDSPELSRSQGGTDSVWRIDFSEFELEELVSEGSAGNLYLGYWFSVPVAIKKLKVDEKGLSENDRKQIENEYKMLKQINHPYIAQFLGLCNHYSGIYLVFEYIEQGDLFDLLMFGTSDLSWLDCMRISYQVAQACYYLHSRGIIHRDIKSPNILIGKEHKIKLCDMGLATFKNSPKFRDVTTRAGTDQWMAPEIFLGANYDEKVDIFSFGLVITELICKKPPPNRTPETKYEFNQDLFLSEVPSDCPRDFARLAIACASWNPTERPTFKDIVSLLQLLINDYNQNQIESEYEEETEEN